MGELDQDEADKDPERGINIGPKVPCIAFKRNGLRQFCHNEKTVGDVPVRQCCDPHDRNTKDEQLIRQLYRGTPEQLDDRFIDDQERSTKISRASMNPDKSSTSRGRTNGRIGWLGGLPHREKGNHRGDQVHGRVDGFRDDADRADCKPDNELHQHETGIGEDREPCSILLELVERLLSWVGLMVCWIYVGRNSHQGMEHREIFRRFALKYGHEPIGFSSKGRKPSCIHYRINVP